MGGYAVAAPLALGGPPGWVAWAVTGTVLTVGAIWAGNEVYEATRDRAEPTTAPTTGTVAQTDTRTCETCARPYSVRVHAQGRDIGGTTRSTIGAPPLTQVGTPIPAAAGVALSQATWALLQRRQRQARAAAKASLDAFILARPPAGFTGQRSFYGPDRSGGKRYDVDSYGPGPNFIA